MRQRPQAVSAIVLAVWACCIAVNGADLPRIPRLAISPQGTVLAGCQLRTATEPEFELYTHADGMGMVSLGRYQGILAGVAVNRYDERMYAVVRDGTLILVGDDPASLVIGDARWHLLDLVFYGNQPVAIGLANGALFLAEMDGDGSWRQRGEAIPAATALAGVKLVANGRALHLLYAPRTSDLSGGSLRHLVFMNDLWQERPPLPLGDIRNFTAFLVENEIAVTALAPDPLAADGSAELSQWRWGNGRWKRANLAPPQVADRLREAGGMAGWWADGASHWLVTSHNGAFMISPLADAGSGTAADALPMARLTAGGQDEEEIWPSLFSLALVLLLIAMTAFFCRRSRQISLLLPGWPPDLSSRVVAIGIDWVLVSIGMTAYHIAAGDLYILRDLMSIEAVNRMFWINMGALILYTTVCETVFGRTPGKWLTGLTVRHIFGGKPGFMSILIRNSARSIDMFPLVFPGLIGALVTRFNPRRQRLGDILGSTMVRRHAPLHQRKFILASASPRRQELLAALGLDFTVQPSDIVEADYTDTTPSGTALRLAEAKARAAADKVTMKREIVIAADTLVVVDDLVLGKPQDEEDAKRMLTMLSGRSHTVMTGLAVWDSATGQFLYDVEVTEVEFRRLSASEIDQYVASGDPMDKAGAYGVQSGFLVKEVRGSLSNVAGLPMEMLQDLLGELDS